MIQIVALVVTFAVALVGIFYDESNLHIKYILAVLAGVSFLSAVLIQIQASRDASFTKRTLERLIKATTPSHLFATVVTKIIVRQGSECGLQMCRVTQRNKREGYSRHFEFYDAAVRTITGYFEFDHEKLAEWSLLDDKNLERQIRLEMFEKGPYPGGSPLDHWDTLAEFLGKVASGLYPKSVRDGLHGIWARQDLIYLGVPYPPDVPVGDSDRAIVSKLGGRDVAVLTFQEEHLVKLIGKSQIDASRIVATDLAYAWGPPNVLNEITTDP